MRTLVARPEQLVLLRALSVPVAAAWCVATAGCLPPPRMQLSAEMVRGQRKAAWWRMQDEDTPQRAVVAIERRLSPSAVKQWLFTGRGLRCFDYSSGRLVRWSAPLSPQAPDNDSGAMRSALRARLGCDDADGWPPEIFSPDEVARLHRLGNLTALLDRCWSEGETQPPPGLTRGRIDDALGAGRFTIFDLLQSGM